MSSSFFPRFMSSSICSWVSSAKMPCSSDASNFSEAGRMMKFEVLEEGLRTGLKGSVGRGLLFVFCVFLIDLDIFFVVFFVFFVIGFLVLDLRTFLGETFFFKVILFESFNFMFFFTLVFLVFDAML